MAKSARSSDRKRNNAKLRSTIFGPAHDARTERLSAKLQELASKPKPDHEKRMEVDAGDGSANSAQAATQQDSDAVMSGIPHKPAKTLKKKSSNRVEKSSRRKPKNQIVFPVNMAKRKRLAKNKSK